MSRASYYRPPRRLPREDSTAEEEEGPRRRDFAIFLLCLVFFAVILFVGSYVAEGFGRPELALSLRLIGALFATATVGTLVTVAIGYSLTSAFLKREFEKKFKKMDEEQQAQLRRMTGQADSDEEAS